MANSNIKKNAQGYGYKYTDLAEIHNFLESQGIEYYQYIEPVDGVDYIWTVPIVNGEEKKPRRGCRIIEAKLSGKDNPVQAYGASLTYCRRYSLLMAMGLATTDDDAACLTATESSRNESRQPDKKAVEQQLKKLIAQKGMTNREVCEMAEVKGISDMHLEQMKNLIGYLNTL